MVDKQQLLVEIGTEELPPKALGRLSRAFVQNMASQLQQQQLSCSGLRGFASPRRLAVSVSDLAVAQATQQVERKGPALAAAFDDAGKPTRAAQGFARSCGVEPAELETLETPKGAWLVYRETRPGKSTSTLLPKMIGQALAELPIPKRMRWGTGEEEFVRPVHWVLVLLGDQIVDGEKIMGLAPGRMSYGHRFHHPQAIEIPHPRDYEPLLRQQGRVYADMAQRRQVIHDQVESVALKMGLRALIDDDLLDEVAALVEWPSAIMGSFDPQFLEIPAEALIKTMQEHQKYFPVVAEDGSLRPHFITVSNIVSLDPEQVRSGNERVIRPRFSDAAFFWEQDLKQPLQAHIDSLKGVVFEKRLGSLYEKSRRIANLATYIAAELGVDPELIERAAELCKCDLMSQMVGEFPGLQGIMGRYYAERGGEAAEVAAAMEEQYLPRHAGDRLPDTDCGRAIAVADKLDTLVGIFAIGQKPTGVKDPYGLRRAALGVLRILIETPLQLDLKALLEAAARGLSEKLDAEAAVEPVFGYMMDRLKAYYSDRSIDADVVEAVMARHPTQPMDFDLRVRAVAAFRELAAAQSLAAANKRIRNILRRSDDPLPSHPDDALLSDTAEKDLARQISVLEQEVGPLFASGQYDQALTRLASLGPAVDRFFDDVMVMCDDDQLRHNRLALLASLNALFLQVADLSRLQ